MADSDGKTLAVQYYPSPSLVRCPVCPTTLAQCPIDDSVWSPLHEEDLGVGPLPPSRAGARRDHCPPVRED